MLHVNLLPTANFGVYNGPVLFCRRGCLSYRCDFGRKETVTVKARMSLFIKCVGKALCWSHRSVYLVGNHHHNTWVAKDLRLRKIPCYLLLRLIIWVCHEKVSGFECKFALVPNNGLAPSKHLHLDIFARHCYFVDALDRCLHSPTLHSRCLPKRLCSKWDFEAQRMPQFHGLSPFRSTMEKHKGTAAYLFSSEKISLVAEKTPFWLICRAGPFGRNALNSLVGYHT